MAKCGIGRFDKIPGLQNISRQSYYLYFIKLIDMLLNRFKYTNVPESLDVRYLELQLIETGQAVIFKDEFLGICAFGCTYDGTPDQYGIPINRQAISANGNTFADLDPGNSVIIFNNRVRSSDIQVCAEYARRLYEIQRSIDTNILMQKYSGLVLTDDGQRLTMQNTIAKWQGDSPIIFAGSGFNKDAFQTLGFNIPFVGDELFTLKNKIYNEFLTFMGIINTNADKKERMIVNEAMAPFGSIELNRNSYLNERRKAIEEVNKMYGTDISVEFDSVIPLNPDLLDRGADDGVLYD